MFLHTYLLAIAKVDRISCDLALNESCEWQIIKKVGVVLPHSCIAVLPQTFIIETIHLGNLSALMVTTQNGDAVFEPDLQQAWVSPSYSSSSSSLPRIGCTHLIKLQD